MNHYYVYEWFFKDTMNVFYVGKGKERRYKERKDRNDKFKKYVSKFDCDSRIIKNNLSEHDAFALEVKLIKHYKELGQCECNLTDGGENPPKHFGVDAPNRRKVVQLSLHGNYIKTWEYISQIEKELGFSNAAISGCCQKKYGRKSVGGFLWSYEEDYLNDKHLKLDRKTNSKVVFQFHVDGTLIKKWNSAKEAAESLGIKASGICGCLKGTYKTSNGYFWSYSNEIKIKKTTRAMKPIVQLDYQNKLIAKFRSCEEAAKSLGKTNSNIVRCCNNERISAYGFKWMYEYEFLKSGK